MSEKEDCFMPETYEASWKLVGTSEDFLKIRKRSLSVSPITHSNSFEIESECFYSNCLYNWHFNLKMNLIVPAFVTAEITIGQRTTSSHWIEPSNTLHKETIYGYLYFNKADWNTLWNPFNPPVTVTIKLAISLPCTATRTLAVPTSAVDHDLPQHFKKLLLEDLQNSDVVLTVQGEEFKAHKNILSVRSEVFAAMLKHPMKESENNRVEIEDIKASVFKELLAFIYTGQAEVVDENAKELFIAADKYSLAGLKAVCERYMISTLSKENIVERLVLADIYNAPQFKDYGIDYVVRHGEPLMATPEWCNAFQNAENKLDIMQAICLRLLEDRTELQSIVERFKRGY